MASALKVIYFLLLIGPLITIHELGHFLVAKLFRVKVLRFSIGFGPRLLGFQKGETTYQIALLPLGGYVKMAGDDPTERPKPEDAGRGFLEQPPWKRSLIALAGPVTNLVFPILIYFSVFYFQAQAVSSRVGQVDPESAAAAAGIRPGDRIVAVDGQPVQYFDDVRELVGPKWDQHVAVQLEHADGSRATVDVVPRRIEETVILKKKARGILGIRANQPAPVVGIDDPGSPAGKAGLLPLDRITHVAGAPVKLFSDLEREVAKQQGPFEVQLLRAERLATPGVPAWQMVPHKATIAPVAGSTMVARTGLGDGTGLVGDVAPDSPAAVAGLQRGDRVVKANDKPIAAWVTLERIRTEAKTAPIALDVIRGGKHLTLSVVQRDIQQENDLGNMQAILYFGALPDQTEEPGEFIPIHRGILASLGMSLKVVPDTISTVVEALGGVLTHEIAFKTVGGPVMLFDIASKSAEAGWEVFLAAMAAISINLGIFNLLPVPILDGFQVLSAGLEWIRRRPLSLRAREVANVIGLAMLLLLMAFVLKNDIFRHFSN